MSYLRTTQKLIRFARAAKHSPVVLSCLKTELRSDFRFVHDHQTSTECFVAAVDNLGYVLAFKPSKEFEDWVYTNPNMTFSTGPFGDMHTGYREAFLSVSDEIVSTLNELRDKNGHGKTRRRVASRVPNRFYITGHSLGGALAVTAAIYASVTVGYPPVTGVHTYGQPRVFSRQAAKEYDELLKGRTYRFMTAGDGVTTMPPAIFGYKHVGQLNYFQPNGVLNLNPSAVRMQKDRLLDYLSEIVNWEWYKFEDHSLELLENYVHLAVINTGKTK